MNSMTGFGRAETLLGDTHDVVVEISAVNRRNLEIGISLPRDWGDLDPEIQPRLREKIHRGRISFSLKIGTAQQAVTGNWDEDAIASTLLELRELAGRNNVPFEPDPVLLYRIATSQSEGRLPAWRDHKDTLFQAVDGALDRFVAMREKEGAAMQADMLHRLGVLTGIADRVEPRVSGQVPAYKEILLKRLHGAGLDIDLDDERVLKEIALYAEKCDVAEELTRLRSHLDQMRGTIKEEGAIGRKLEFLLQEVFREINTLGNKSSDLEIIQAVIDAKGEVEKLREQALNAE